MFWWWGWKGQVRGRCMGEERNRIRHAIRFYMHVYSCILSFWIYPSLCFCFSARYIHLHKSMHMHTYILTHTHTHTQTRWETICLLLDAEFSTSKGKKGGGGAEFTLLFACLCKSFFQPGYPGVFDLHVLISLFQHGHTGVHVLSKVP